MNKLCLLICLLLTISGLNAQTRDISGIVTNEKNEAIAGASVKVKTNTQAAFTDDNGTFTLTGVPDTATLVVSAKGYQDQEVAIVDKTTLTIILVKAAAPAQLAGTLYPVNALFTRETGEIKNRPLSAYSLAFFH
jgi:hypothetical protein